MLPYLSQNDVANGGLVDAKGIGYRLLSMLWILCADACNSLGSQFGVPVSFTRWLTIPLALHHIVRVVQFRALDDMARIYASGRVAGVPSYGSRPMTIGEKEGHSMGSMNSPIEIQGSISKFRVSTLCERPNEAGVRVVCFDCVDKPRSSYEMIGHLLSLCSTESPLYHLVS